MFMPTARASRNTRVLSITAMITTMNTVSGMPRRGAQTDAMVISSSAKISDGIAISTSTARLSNWSSQPPSVAARKPSVPPRKNASSVVAKAMPTVFCAP